MPGPIIATAAGSLFFLPEQGEGMIQTDTNTINIEQMLKEDDSLHKRQQENVKYFRDAMIKAGFDIKPTQSAIVAVMLYDAPLSQKFAAKMADEGIFVTGFYYPVVPKGQARIRVQLSAAHTREHLDKAIAAFVKVGRELGVIK